jgi:hypothetical protein
MTDVNVFHFNDEILDALETSLSSERITTYIAMLLVTLTQPAPRPTDCVAPQSGYGAARSRLRESPPTPRWA